MAYDSVENEIRNYKRNTTSYERLKDTIVAQQSYLNYERDQDQPNDSEVEVDWIHIRKKLYQALQTLTHRQREVLTMIAVKGLKEYEVAGELGLNQSTVSRHFHAAKRKMAKLMDK